LSKETIFLVNVFVEGKLECERTIEDYSDLVLKAVGVDDAVVTYEMDEKYLYKYNCLRDVRRSKDLKITKEGQNQEGGL
jgi:dTDP-glucose 4,6-dehydratase